MKDAITISQFFENYKSIRNQAGKALAEDAQRKLPDFFRAFSVIHQQILAEKKRDSPDYNLFHILRIRHLETVTHTPFLVNLLNPEGSHAQGDLFLRFFLQKVVGFGNSGQFRLQELKENKHAQSLGFMDIFLRFESDKKQYALVIENKLYAGDQPEQLKRYFDYCKNVMGYADEQIKILYLTIDGKIPTNQSYKQIAVDFASLSGKSVLTLAGYKKEIAAWLEECSQFLPHQGKLYFSLQQYLQTIRYL